MSESREQIRRDIAERRAAMRETLDQLEDRVRSSTQLRRRALEHPLPLLGAALAAGLVFGRLTAPARRPPGRPAARLAAGSARLSPPSSSTSSMTPPAPPSRASAVGLWNSATQERKCIRWPRPPKIR